MILTPLERHQADIDCMSNRAKYDQGGWLSGIGQTLQYLTTRALVNSALCKVPGELALSTQIVECEDFSRMSSKGVERLTCWKMTSPTTWMRAGLEQLAAVSVEEACTRTYQRARSHKDKEDTWV